MSLFRLAAKRDANENVLVDCLRSLGFNVTRTSGMGLPDLILSRRQVFHLAEVKSRYGKYTPAQLTFKAHHSAPVYRLETLDDCLALSKAAP